MTGKHSENLKSAFVSISSIDKISHNFKRLLSRAENQDFRKIMSELTNVVQTVVVVDITKS